MGRLKKSLESIFVSGFRVPIIIILLLVTASCATTGIEPAGFLSNYDLLKEDETEKGIFWWEKKGADWKKYARFMIDPVVVLVDIEKSEREMTPEEIERLAVKLRDYAVMEIKDKYPIVNKPAPDVLRIRTALTHLKPVNPALNIVSAAVIMIPVDAGKAMVEVQFCDALSGDILGELTAENRTGIKTATTQVWTRWGQVEAAFKNWARILKTALDETYR